MLRHFLRFSALGVLLVVAGFATCPMFPHERLTERVLPTPSRVYARPLVVVPGQPLGVAAISAHLERAGYRRTAQGASLVAGTFKRDGDQLIVGRRAFRYPDGEDAGGNVILTLGKNGRVESVRDGDGGYLESVFLEPEVIGSLFGEDEEDRILVPLERIPQVLQDAVLVTEDRRFAFHPGVDPVRIAGAALENAREGRVVEGGSTLTQQLVKNVYLSPERTFSRKLREMAIAVWISLRYSKSEVLEAYLNQIYLGQDGGRSINGVARASRFYFDKHLSALSPADAALLAGIIQAPSALSPFRNPERAKERRNLVLGLLLEEGTIDEETHATAVAAPLGVKREARPARFAAHYVDFVRGRLQQRFAEDELERDGFEVFTTLDGTYQRAADDAVARGLRELEKNYPKLRRKKSPLQAALVALDPGSGDVIAWVGGRDYATAPFDRANLARRQPGSVFKPLVAMAAITAPERGRFTLATILEDEPLEMVIDGESWAPSNHDSKHRGAVTLREALEDSLNVPFARLGMEVGLVHVAETARRAGVTSPLRPIPSLSLGAFEMTPLEVATAYGSLASGGFAHRPRTTLAIVEPDGNARRGDPFVEERVFSETETFLITSGLEGVVDRGTGKTLRRMGFSGPFAGKTGTTNDFRDAWFVGYTHDLVVVVWVGFDDGARVGLTGARAALPIVGHFLNDALEGRTPVPFARPAAIVSAEIHAESGLLATERCPGETEIFLPGTAPKGKACQRGWPSWLERMLTRQENRPPNRR
jgi:penicillin-binding protein 1B